MSRIYSTFDEPTLGPNLALTETDHVLKMASTGNAHRLARSTAALDVPSRVEMIIWSPSGSPPSLVSAGGVPPLAVGICTSAASGTDFLGHDTHGIGYCPGDGKVYKNNAVLTTWATAPLGSYLYPRLIKADDGSLQFVVELGNDALGDPIALTPGELWEYASTISGDPDQLAVLANPGDTPMRYPAGDLGWWTPGTVIEPILVATEPRISAPDDDIPNQVFSGDIDRATSPITVSGGGVRFWMMGASAPADAGSGAVAQIQLNDPNNIYGRVLDPAAKGQRVPIARGVIGAMVSDDEAVFSGVLDHGEPGDSSQVKRVYLRDQCSRLAVPLKRPQFPPTADPAVAGKKRPTLIGPARNFTPELEDAATDTYALGDGAITGFGTNRDSGKPLVLGTDFTISADGASIVYASTPVGRPTVEATSFGGGFDPVAPDYWSGAADFTTLTPDGNNIPTGWTIKPTPDSDDGFGHQAGFRLVAGVGLKCICHAFEYKMITPPGSVPKILAGRTYSFRLRLLRVPQFGEHLGSGPPVTPPAVLYFAYNPVPANALFFNFAALSLDHSGTGTAGEYTGTFTSPLSTDETLRFVQAMNSVEAGSHAWSLNYLMIESFAVNELPAVTDAAELGGPGLDGMLRSLMIDRGPVALSEYDGADALAIDAVTGYKYGIRVPSSQDPNIDTLVDQVTDSCTAKVYNDAPGRFRVLRMFKPEDVADADIDGTLTISDFAGEQRRIVDEAENLTTSCVGRKNIDKLTASEYGDTTLGETPAAERAVLAAGYQWTRQSRVRLAPRYAFAYGRPPKELVLDVADHGQHFIDHACSPYTDERAFYVGPKYDPPGRGFRVGGVWDVPTEFWFVVPGSPGLPTYLAAQHPMRKFVVKTWQRLVILDFAQRQPTENRSTPIFWGL